MTDMMHGPSLAGAPGTRPVSTRLFALIDDCSRLCTAAAYYPGESLQCRQLGTLPAGSYLSPAVSWDGRRVLFSFCQTDPAATDWAIAMASSALARGGKIGLYPEGTRSPDPTKLHRLHDRVLIPVLRDNPDVPAFVVATAYKRRPARRTRVQVRISSQLPLDPRTMTPEAIITVVRDALLDLGGQTYVDRSARDVKANRTGEIAE